MAEKAKTELERIYTIPLRDVKSSPRNHRTDRAVRAVKAYLSRHMKAENVWIDASVNEKLWSQGMYQIPSKIRVRALKFDDGVVEVTLPEADVTASQREALKKKREEKADEKEKKAEKKEKEEAEKAEGEKKEGTPEKKEGAPDEKPAPKKEPAEASEKEEPAAKKPVAKGEEKAPAKPAAAKKK